MSVTSVNVLDGPNIQADGKHRGVLEFVFHTGETERRNVRAVNEAIWLALPDTMIPEMETFIAGQEIQQWILDIENGLDPAHIEISDDNFVNSVPNHNTWEDAVAGAVTPFLQIIAPEQTEALVTISALWGRLSKAEGEAFAGKNNGTSAEIAIATNTKTINDTYIPLIGDDGVPRDGW